MRHALGFVVLFFWILTLIRNGLHQFAVPPPPEIDSSRQVAKNGIGGPVQRLKPQVLASVVGAHSLTLTRYPNVQHLCSLRLL